MRKGDRVIRLLITTEILLVERFAVKAAGRDACRAEPE
jgi:hypothetical protein